MKKWWKEVENVAENLGWTTSGSSDDDDWRFSIGSPRGQDCNIEVDAETLDELRDSIFNFYENYDPSEEAYVWLDNTGHGKNGAPYDMGDVYADMVWFQDKAKELWLALNEIN